MNNYFITGTSSGIGKAIVEELIQIKNTKTVGFSRTNTISHPQFTHNLIDLTKTEDLNKLVFPKLKHNKRVVLINNAGSLGEIKHIGQQSKQNIFNTIQLNFTAAVILSNQFIAQYQDLDCEKIIINISSGAATSPYDGWANYCSTKAAINMFTLVIDKEQKTKQFPIKCFAIAPGVVDTIMQDSIRASSSEQFSNIEKFVDLKNNNQLYQTKDVAKELIKMINNTEQIPDLISRISL